MIESGILTENDPVELIRGEIVQKMPIGHEHAAAVKRLNHLVTESFRGKATVGVQDPIRLADSEPEPDLTLLTRRSDFYVTNTPLAADILLVVEVADSTLDYDREVKSRLYAENGIPEYWIVNLLDRCLEVYRKPRPDGTYEDEHTLRPGDHVTVLALPGPALAVADLVS